MITKKTGSKISVLLATALIVFYQAPLVAKEESAPVGTATTSTSKLYDAGQEAKPSVSSREGQSPEAGLHGTFTSLSKGQGVVDSQIQPNSAGLDGKMSLDLRNIEVADAIRYIAQKGGVNLAVSKNVSGRVQLLLNDVPLRDILDIILITNQLAYEKRDDIYYIMTEAEFKERFGRKFSDVRKVKVFRLKYAIPDQAFSLFEMLKSEIGRLLVDPESGTVLVMDSQENIDRMQIALEGLEQKRSIKVYSLKYAKASEVEARLKAQLDSKKVGLVSFDERTNQVIVETLSQRMEDIDKLVESLDKKTKEVLIDAKIIKVTMTDDYHAEIKWEGLERFGAAFVGNHPFSPVARAGQSFVDNFTNIARTTNPPAGAKNTLTENLYSGYVDGSNAFETLLNFLRTLGDTKILSNPKLAVVNNQEAKIHVGQKQAYVTTTTTTGGQGIATTAEAVTFVDVGIQLAVTPTINDDGFVTMKIKPEVSSVVDFLVTPTGNKIPIIDSSLAETSVMVKEGVSIIIGGLRRDEDVGSHKKVPLLGDIPLIGAPFNSSSKTKTHTELLILITPHIVYGDQFLTGSRKAADSPYMTYTDYNAANPLEHKDAVVKTAPAVHS